MLSLKLASAIGEVAAVQETGFVLAARAERELQAASAFENFALLLLPSQAKFSFHRTCKTSSAFTQSVSF